MKGNGKDNFGTAWVVLVSEFIINILQIVRTTGQPAGKKLYMGLFVLIQAENIKR